MKIVYLYLIIINAAGLLYMLMDKYRAKKNLWRIPEARLMGIALLGGSLGVLAGMNLARHKTKHPVFFIGLPVMLMVHILIFILLHDKN